jgi:hypothetical protein
MVREPPPPIPTLGEIRHSTPVALAQLLGLPTSPADRARVADNQMGAGRIAEWKYASSDIARRAIRRPDCNRGCLRPNFVAREKQQADDDLIARASGDSWRETETEDYGMKPLMPAIGTSRNTSGMVSIITLPTTEVRF